jgi:Holliday junction resolvase RusA-like endonuclease
MYQPLTVEQYRELAKGIQHHAILPQIFFKKIFEGEYSGEVVAKERHRTGANGHAYTPARTEQFEKSVRTWAVGSYYGPIALCPLRVEVVVRETAPKSWGGRITQLGRMGWLFNEKNDVDNKAKSIFDGMNGTVFRDDRQIAHLTISRRISDEAGFSITIWRHGFSLFEAQQLIKFF